MSHHCHAKGCLRSCAPALLMCPKHWWMVPRELRLAVWREYRSGQELDKRPSAAWHAAADAAIAAVFELERKDRELQARQGSLF